MKILYVITKANWGGAQRYVFDLATSMQKDGHDVTVAYGAPGELARKLHETDVRTIPLSSLGRDVNASADAASFGSILSTLKAQRPDVVHLNSSKAGALGAVAARLTFVKRIVFTAHGWAFNEDRPFFQKWIIALIHYVTVLLSHTTICVSDAVKKDAAWMPFVQHKLHVIHLGLSEPNFLDREAARQFLFPKLDNGFIVGMLGELHPTKGIFEALDAFAQAVNSIPDAYLIIMGEGGARLDLEREIAGHHLANRVLLLGHVTDASKYLKAYDIFLFPSHSEALGYALLEAGLAALPAIATQVGGIPEIIENEKTGLLVARGDIHAITQKIVQLENAPVLRRSLGEALRTKVSSTFAIERMIKGTLSYYTS